MPPRTRLVAALAALALVAASPGGRLEPGDSAPLPPLVVEQDGRWTLDLFEACGPGDGSTTLQLLTHGEAPVAAIDRERFAAAVSRAAWTEIAKLAESGRLRCREIQAPLGDVDHEIDVRIGADGVEVSSVDVSARNATLDTGYRARARRRNSSGSEPPPGPCASTALGQTFCAHAPQGVAVKTTMGEVVCARGSCVRESNGSWHCARQSGGGAELAPTGPACDGGCYAPTTRQCRRA